MCPSALVGIISLELKMATELGFNAEAKFFLFSMKSVE
jgi:hypothetical protein